MGFYLTTLITVVLIALPAGRAATIAAVDDLGHAGEGSIESRRLFRQVDQQIAFAGIIGAASDRHRCGRDAAGFDEFMRHKAATAEGPKQIVQAPGIGLGFGVGVNPVGEYVSLLRQTAGEL
jgi:hypothetical protein